MEGLELQYQSHVSEAITLSPLGVPFPVLRRRNAP